MTPPASLFFCLSHGNHQCIQRVTIKTVDNLLFLFIAVLVFSGIPLFPRMLLLSGYCGWGICVSNKGKAIMETTAKIVLRSLQDILPRAYRGTDHFRRHLDEFRYLSATWLVLVDSSTSIQCKVFLRNLDLSIGAYPEFHEEVGNTVKRLHPRKVLVGSRAALILKKQY
jgi:hypothetical protein